MLTTRDDEARRTEAIVRHLQAGGSIADAARELELKASTLAAWWRDRNKQKNSREIDPAILAGMQAVGTEMVPSGMWVKQPGTKDEPGYSVYLRPEHSPEITAERIRAALEALPPIAPIAAPSYADDDLLTVIPLADVHFGMLAWGRETGEDYDLSIAAERVRDWVGKCVAASPASGTAVLLDVGDLTHADDDTNQTPRSKHSLDTDSRMFKTLETAIATLALAIETTALKHRHVIVRILPGNHNQTSYMTILFALAQRYRDNPRITVQAVPGEWFVHEFGEVMIAAHHGHGAKADRMVHRIADDFAPAWGRTKHRFLFTGHLHHHKSQDIGGVTWEQLRAVTARDAYAVSHAYCARAQLQAITVHRTRGEVQRVKVGA